MGDTGYCAACGAPVSKGNCYFIEDWKGLVFCGACYQYKDLNRNTPHHKEYEEIMDNIKQIMGEANVLAS